MTREFSLLYSLPIEETNKQLLRKPVDVRFSYAKHNKQYERTPAISKSPKNTSINHLADYKIGGLQANRKKIGNIIQRYIVYG